MSHAVVIPLYGVVPPELCQRLQMLLAAGFLVVLVDNGCDSSCDNRFEEWAGLDCVMVANHNVGGVAGGFNRGVTAALEHGATWITLLDQDSALSPVQLQQLRLGWLQAVESIGSSLLLVGPRVVDATRASAMRPSASRELQPTRLLISSGTTFPAELWPGLGSLREWLVIDFVDHDWCFQLQGRGYRLFEVTTVLLRQTFGSRHPNGLCHLLGMQLYSPRRHYYAVRNLRWLVRQSHVPLDLRWKELLKMLLKIPLWLVFEPQRGDNLRAILAGLLDPLMPA